MAARLVQFFALETISMSEFRWDHLHLRSPDPEATARYYVDVFGATPVNKVDAGGALRVIVNPPG